MTDQMEHASIPPISPEMEENTLGAMLIRPNLFIILCAMLKTDDFFYLRHQWIYDAIRRVMERHGTYEVSIIAEEIKAMGKLEEIGGIAYLYQLINNTPSSAHGEIYGKLVKRLSVRRDLVTAADEIKAIAIDEDLSLETVIAESEKRMLKAVGQSMDNHTVGMDQAVGEIIDHVEKMIQSDQEFSGLPTGLISLDSLLLGMKPGEFILTAGRPGVGKTAVLMTIATYLARRGIRVLFWSGEMRVMSNMARILSAETNISSNNLTAGRLVKNDWNNFIEATSKVLKFSLRIDTTPGITPQGLKSLILREKFGYGVDIVIMDYIGLMRVPGLEQNRTQEVSQCSLALKELAMSYNIPILAGAQLNRKLEDRQDKRPQLSDLRDSGSLEQDADVVTMLYRDEMYNEITDSPNQMDIIVAKNRNGPTDTLSYYYDKWTTQVLNPRQTNRIDLGQV